MATEDVSKRASARNVAVERKNLITVCRSVRLARKRDRGSGTVFRHEHGSWRPFVLLLRSFRGTRICGSIITTTNWSCGGFVCYYCQYRYFDTTASVIIKIEIVADQSRSERLFCGPQERGNAIQVPLPNTRTIRVQQRHSAFIFFPLMAQLL